MKLAEPGKLETFVAPLMKAKCKMETDITDQRPDTKIETFVDHTHPRRETKSELAEREQAKC